MTLKPNILILILTLASFSLFAQPFNYQYKRDILNVTENWHSISLPNDIFGKIQNQLNDIRIYGITKNNDTVEAPYILKISDSKSVPTQIPFTTLNQSHNKNGFYITFEIPTTKAINNIALDFNTQNFDWKIKLEASHDLKSWFTLLDNYRIIAITNNITNFKFTTLNFPNAKYRYFRVFIASNKDPNFVNAHLSQNQTLNSTYNQYPIKHFSANTTNKQTEIDIELPMALPISYITLNTNNPFDYYRPITIKHLTDSTKTQNGWKYSYSTLTSGILNSVKKEAFKFNSVITKKLKVIIHNQDNPPLTVNTIQIKGFQHQLITRINEPARYILAYGNTKASTPNYDLSYFHDKIPANITPLRLGKEQQIIKLEPETATPLFQNKIWLWLIMIVIIVLLGSFTFKMMKSS